MDKKLKARKLVCTINAILAFVCLAGCTGQVGSNVIANSGSFEVTPEATVSSSDPVYVGMEKVLTDGSFYYYRDVTTDVMYVLYWGDKEGGLTVMMDPNTNGPLTYDNWLKYQSE